MIELINTKAQIKKAKLRYLWNLILIILFIGIYAVGSVLILILSKEDYTISMIIDIVISVLCLSFLAFYFINFFPVVRHYYRFYCSMENNTFERKRIVSFEREEEAKIKDGVEYRQLIFSYKENDKIFYDRVFVLDSNEKFESNKLIKIITFQNVLLRYEVVEDASDK